MRAARILTLSCALVLTTVAGAAAQQAGAVSGEELQAAVVTRSAEIERQRSEVRVLLARPQVRQLARNAGIDMERAEGAVGTLGTTQLQQIAPLARTANTHFAAGEVITVTTTTIILVLLIVILLVLLV